MDKNLYISDHFDLTNTLFNGQYFRWERLEDGVFQGVALGRALRLRQVDHGVQFDCSMEDFSLWRDYFDLDTDYGVIEQDLSCEDIIAPHVATGTGMHILRQDLWEVLVSFIISQNNHIKRIKSIVGRLCTAYGQPIQAYGETFYSFPTAQRLKQATLQELEGLGLGYRAGYVHFAANLVADRPAVLTELQKGSYEEAREILLTFYGIGPKVANCILLFGLRHLSAFPVDTWVRKAMRALYPECGTTNMQIEQYGTEKFGQYGGIVQQYLFYAARQGKMKIA